MTRAALRSNIVGFPKSARSILYIGSASNEFCEYFTRYVGQAEFTYKELVYDAFLAARSKNFDVVVVDQRGDKLATKLVLPVLSTLTRVPDIVVVCSQAEVSHYLSVPGVSRVISTPVKQTQLLVAVGLEDKREESDRTTVTAESNQDGRSLIPPLKHAANGETAELPGTTEQAASPLPSGAEAHAALDAVNRFLKVFRIGSLTNLISALYKRAAFVLLASLFAAFCFYGVLIVFFLMSSSWAAPMTLTRGHELVAKAEAQLAQLRVDLNLTEQRIAEAHLESDAAMRNRESAKLMMDYSAGTVEKEIAKLEKSAKTGGREIQRLASLLKLFQNELGGDGMKANLARLYKDHLIDKKTFNSGTLGILDANQKLQQLESELESKKDAFDNLSVGLSMLRVLKSRIAGVGTGTIVASSPEYLQLAKQALDARAAFDSATAELKIADKKMQTITNSRSVIERHTSELEATPQARAIVERVDVLFVPYGNEGNVVKGAPLYSCAFTIFWCAKAGIVGDRFPGESGAVHPFFGKPIRGIFVEVQLTDQHAATREIMHVGRPPLFF